MFEWKLALKRGVDKNTLILSSLFVGKAIKLNLEPIFANLSGVSWTENGKPKNGIPEPMFP